MIDKKRPKQNTTAVELTRVAIEHIAQSYEKERSLSNPVPISDIMKRHLDSKKRNKKPVLSELNRQTAESIIHRIDNARKAGINRSSLTIDLEASILRSGIFHGLHRLEKTVSPDRVVEVYSEQITVYAHEDMHVKKFKQIVEDIIKCVYDEGAYELSDVNREYLVGIASIRWQVNRRNIV